MVSCKLDRSHVQPLIKHFYFWSFIQPILSLVHDQKWKNLVATRMGHPLVQPIRSQDGQVTHLSNLRPNMENFGPKQDRSTIQVVIENLHFWSFLGPIPLLGCNQNWKLWLHNLNMSPPCPTYDRKWKSLIITLTGHMCGAWDQTCLLSVA